MFNSSVLICGFIKQINSFTDMLIVCRWSRQVSGFTCVAVGCLCGVFYYAGTAAVCHYHSDSLCLSELSWGGWWRLQYQTWRWIRRGRYPQHSFEYVAVSVTLLGKNWIAFIVCVAFAAHCWVSFCRACDGRQTWRGSQNRSIWLVFYWETAYR